MVKGAKYSVSSRYSCFTFLDEDNPDRVKAAGSGAIEDEVIPTT